MAGQSKPWHNRFRFLVEIDGFVSSGFQTAGPLTGGVEVTEHHEGSGMLPHKSPGKGNFENVTLTRGATTNDDEYNWFASVLNAAANKGGVNDEDFKRDFAIIEQDNAGNEVKRWNVYGAFPVSFTAGEWDATAASEKTIRTVELAIDYFEPA